MRFENRTNHPKGTAAVQMRLEVWLSKVENRMLNLLTVPSTGLNPVFKRSPSCARTAPFVTRIDNKDESGRRSRFVFPSVDCVCEKMFLNRAHLGPAEGPVDKATLESAAKAMKEWSRVVVFDDAGQVIASTFSVDPAELSALTHSWDERDVTVGEGLHFDGLHFEVHRCVFGSFHENLL